MIDRIEIREGGLDDSRVISLLETHLRAMHSQSPPESTHALDLSGLSDPKVTFWSVWDDGDLLAVGAMKKLEQRHSEIKSMHTAHAARGRGIAKRLLTHIEDYARAGGMTRLSLETGTPSEFSAARTFYAKAGYSECPPFASYKLDPYSVFMTKEL